ncbi:MAG: segregation ATPase FtsK/SpoIIIE, family, partial [Verrucomicrobiota bacterium]
MSKNPGVSDTLRLLERLKGLVRDFAAREEKLNSEFRLKSGAEQTAFTAELDRRATELSINTANEQATFEAGQDHRESHYQARKEKILNAHAKLRKKAFDDISNEEGHKKHKIQTSALNAERQRDKELEEATTRREDFQDRLAQANIELSALQDAAEKAFGGYPGLRKLLSPEHARPAPDLSSEDDALLEELLALIAKTRDELDKFQKNSLPKLVRVFGKSSATPAATAIAENLFRARRLHDACFEKSELRLQQDRQRIHREFDETNDRLNREWKLAVKAALDLRTVRPIQVDEKAGRITEKHEQSHRAKQVLIQTAHKESMARLTTETETGDQQFKDAYDSKMAELRSWHEHQWVTLETEWKNSVAPLCEEIRLANETAEKLFPEWDVSRWKDWTPPAEFKNAARFARLEVELEKFAEVLPKDPRLALPCASTFTVPLSLTYPNEGSILFEAAKGGHEDAISSVNNIIFRLLATIPPGKLSLTIFDPVGLGQNFAGIMHLADYEESHINSRIWTQQNQFEEKLAELNEHMEKVIQMYLRNEYETIAEYNAQAGTIAEKYHVLVIASFPANFSDTAARRLRNIATSGARCGVYTLIHWDQRLPLPHDFVPDELRKNSVNLVAKEKTFALANWQMPGTRLLLDAPPSAEFATHFLHEVGKSGKDSNRVEVPFANVAPPEAEIWSEDTSEELRVPIGRSGATKFQYLEIGKGTRQHALIAGKTGSGKSTLFHIMITNLALWCSPEQVEFYLVDFKKGVEFKCYANRRLPHAKVVAIESDRAFGLSVLERVDAELRRRGDLFRQIGAQDVAGYKRAGGKEPMPRSLLLIDEFQEFFTEEDRVSQGAAVLLDRIVRQGRAFGIHVLLGSQTLGGAYTLARATLGQMVIRIALQCNEADAYLIMDQDNPAPRLLSRPGEGIYNDDAGKLEGNSPFQAVWLSDDVRDEYLEKIRQRADQSGKNFPGPFVFEGNAPADVKENAILNALLAER